MEHRRVTLRSIYAKYHEANDAAARDSLAKSGDMFASKWLPFRNRAHHHSSILNDRKYADMLPKVYEAHPFRIPPFIAERLTAASCRLEGNRMTTEDVHRLSVDESQVSLYKSTGIAALPSSVINSCEVSEAYYHMLALYFGQSLLLERHAFYMTEAELLSIHGVLMYPFKDKSPGAYRRWPIQISNWPTAFFPYPAELAGLMPQYMQWLNQAPEGPNVHPFLRACDVFLVTAHLHPFRDGNGRLSRLLATLTMAQGGCRPAVFTDVDRRSYLQAVFAAQHEDKVADFYRFCLTNQQ